jgi:hypothetical protein
MSDPFASLDLLTPRETNYRHGINMNNLGTVSAASPATLQQSFGNKEAMMAQNVMSQFQTSSTPSMIQTQANGPARTQFMTLQPSRNNGSGLSPFSTNPFMDIAPPAPVFHQAPHVFIQPAPPSYQQALYPSNSSFDPFATKQSPISPSEASTSCQTPPPPSFSTGLLQQPSFPTSSAPPLYTTCPSATVLDFDPFSPKGATPRLPFDFPSTSPSLNLHRQDNVTPYLGDTFSGHNHHHSVNNSLNLSIHQLSIAQEANSTSQLKSKRAIVADDNACTVFQPSDMFASNNTFLNTRGESDDGVTNPKMQRTTSHQQYEESEEAYCTSFNRGQSSFE